jgi:hypothetical protein
MEKSVGPQIELRRKAGKAGLAPVSAQVDTTVLAGTGNVAAMRQLLGEIEAEENRLLAQRSPGRSRAAALDGPGAERRRGGERAAWRS